MLLGCRKTFPALRRLSTRTLTSSAASQSPRDRNDHNDNEQTHFGNRNVPIGEKQRLVSSVFSSVAGNYDVMNDLMSVGVHRIWKDAFVNDMSPTGDMTILDCAGGTGDIAFRIARHIENYSNGWINPESGITVCDINEDMLLVGQSRMPSSLKNDRRVSFVKGDAQELPFEDDSFDIYAISFGMRNVPRPDVALSEALRVLKPGGRFMMLEFAKVHDKAIPVSQIYDLWSFQVIPNIGRLIARDEDAYRYLVESIRKFPDQKEFSDMVRRAGFSATTVTNYSFGIAACYSAFKLKPAVFSENQI